jgi:MFS family permease
VSTLVLDRAGLSKKHVIAATTVGTALEFYDFTIYSFFAIQIGQLFFPGASPVNQFLLSIGVFGVGFVVRPLGGIVIGAYADRVGRKKAMVLTIMLMALSCTMIACAPPYAVAGIAAPFIVLTARLIQGFAAGGEFGPGTTLLVEYATDQTRAFFASWNFAATALGLALGALVATLVNVALPKQDVLDWGWRLPFLLGIVAAPAGMLIRRRLEETLVDRAPGAPRPQGALKAALTTHLKLDHTRHLRRTRRLRVGVHHGVFSAEPCRSHAASFAYGGGDIGRGQLAGALRRGTDCGAAGRSLHPQARASDLAGHHAARRVSGIRFPRCTSIDDSVVHHLGLARSVRRGADRAGPRDDPRALSEARPRDRDCVDLRGERIVFRRVLAIHRELAGGANRQSARAGMVCSSGLRDLAGAGNLAEGPHRPAARLRKHDKETS